MIRTAAGIVGIFLENPIRAYAIGVLLGLLIAFISIYLHNLTNSRTPVVVAASSVVLVFPCLAGICWGAFAAVAVFALLGLAALAAALVILTGRLRDRRVSGSGDA